MANKNHLALLEKGVDAWNAWRKENVTVRLELSGAHLRMADLRMADLRMADLRMANLSGADLSETIFGDTNLTDARGLDSCKHQGPSTIDHRTLMRSGPLPLAFLGKNILA
jgi:pentapeptide repeat protein